MENNFIGISENRLKHSLAVAKECYYLSINIFQKSDLYGKQMFVMGFNHDIGYEYTESSQKNKHNNIGALMLEITFNLTKEKENKFINAIKYHGNPETPEEYRTLEWIILNLADLTVNSKGEKVSVLKRFQDIKERFGSDSKSYLDATKTYELVCDTINKNYKEFQKEINKFVKGE